MATTEVVLPVPGKEQAHLNHLKRDPLYLREKPFQAFVNVPAGERSTNLTFETIDKDVMDVRGREHEYTLKDNGFTYIKRSSELDAPAFDSQEKIEDIYLRECEQLIRDTVDDADITFIFDWRIRRNCEPKEPGQTVDLNDRRQHLLPSVQVHVDTSATSVANRIKYQLGEYADALLEGRVQVINVWRPIRNPVANSPLAVCDGSTVREEDLLVCDHVTARYAAETTYPLANPEQKWYYLKSQRPDEVLLFKNFDSHPDGAASICPHTSFEVPMKDTDPPRESIEVRFMVFGFGDGVDEATRKQIKESAPRASFGGFGV